MLNLLLSRLNLLIVLLCVISGLDFTIADEPNQPQSISVLIQPSTPVGQQAKDEPLSAEAVRRSIDRAIEYLKSKQGSNGTWPQYRMNGDTTTLCTLALLNAEVNPKSKEIQNAIRKILLIPDDQLTTYVTSLRIMTLVAADPQGELYRRYVSKDVKWLVKMQVPKSKSKNSGGWSYGHSVTSGADASNSQFALLALHEARRMGVDVPQTTWQLAKNYWTNCFDSRRGGFCYTTQKAQVRGSMTCAGISSMIIIEENLADIKNEINQNRAACCQDRPETKMVDRAIEWLANNFTVKSNPVGNRRGNRNQLYYLYGMERAGRLAGRRFFGPHDWYRAGAKQLIKQQNKLTGSWVVPRGHGEDNPTIATALALLFLSKGKRPIAIGKYQFGQDRNWDTHPKGVHYLTRQLEDQWKQKLNWQTVRANQATVDDLLEAPVIFLSGRDRFELSAQQKDRLRTYLENGGFLFAEACKGEGCGDGGFEQSFRELMAEIFPASELEPLQPAHPIWNAHFPLLPNSERPLLGLQACCRTSVVFCPANLSAYWALDRPAIKAQDRDKLNDRIDYCSRLGVNVVTYATGRQLKDKGETPKLVEKSAAVLSDRVLVFPKLQHGGGADDAPNAWRNVQREVQQVGLRIKLDKKMIQPDLDQLANYPFVFVHGRGEFRLNDQQRESIRTYLELGGFLFADSICSSTRFTNSFRSEMRTLLGQPLQPIPADHPIWKDPRFGHKIDQVTLRTRDIREQGGFRKSVRSPELEGFEYQGRLAVVFSPHDLSCALENPVFSQCNGYTHDDAVRIGTNVILYSLLSDGGKK